VIGTFGFVFAQGGLGAYPFLVSMVLLYYGTSIELLSDAEIIEKTKLGLAVGWVVWTAESFMYIVLGLVSLLLLSFRKDKKE
jgi:heme/copper-type cytochrome/quinol oxidase subunit 2